MAGRRSRSGQPPRQPARPAIRPRRPAAGHAIRPGRPRTGRGTRRTGHFSSAHRNDVPSTLSGGRGQPQRWAIVAARMTSMGHRCGCPRPAEQHRCPIVAVAARGAGGQVPGGPEARDLNDGHREPGVERAGNRVARNGAVAPDAVTFTLCTPEPHRWAIVAVARTSLIATMAHGCGSYSIDGTSLR